MRRKSKSTIERGKAMTTAAGDVIGEAAIAATRLVIRKASAAVRSADRALYGRTPKRTGRAAKRKRAAVGTRSRRRSAKRRIRRAVTRTRVKAARVAAARARTRSRTATKTKTNTRSRAPRTARSKRRRS